MKLPHISIGIITILAIGYFLLQPKPLAEKLPQQITQPNSMPAFKVKLPAFSDQQLAGQLKFKQNCLRCHGKNATGTQNGPPLIHDYYKPNHHADYAFYRAVQSGVRAHHWPFGDMPALPNVSKDEITQIISYVRAIQRENGIL